MYNHKLAVALKSAGKVLREFGETVYVPFGNEYSVLVKNLNSVRALVKIEIDGVDVGDGTKFVVQPNTDIELERFIKNGNRKEGNRFKFIERTDNIEQHRGIGIEDGIVRIEFNFERILTINPTPWVYTNNDPFHWNDDYKFGNSAGSPRGLVGKSTCDSSGTLRSASVNNVSSGTANLDMTSTNVTFTSTNDAGITVPGSVSKQEFTIEDWFPTEAETHVIIFKLLGQTEDNQQVIKAVTVKAKPKCSSCGRTNKATAKFCTECGTSLTIV